MTECPFCGAASETRTEHWPCPALPDPRPTPVDGVVTDPDAGRYTERVTLRIPRSLETAIDELVDEGAYASRSQAIRAAAFDAFVARQHTEQPCVLADGGATLDADATDQGDRTPRSDGAGEDGPTDAEAETDTDPETETDTDTDSDRPPLRYLRNRELRAGIAATIGSDPTHYTTDHRKLRRAELEAIGDRLRPAEAEADTELEALSLSALYEQVCAWAGVDYTPTSGRVRGLNRPHLKALYRALDATPHAGGGDGDHDHDEDHDQDHEPDSGEEEVSR